MFRTDRPGWSLERRSNASPRGMAAVACLSARILQASQNPAYRPPGILSDSPFPYHVTPGWTRGPTSCGAGVTKKSGPRIRSGATAVVFTSPEPNRAFRPRPYCRRLQSVYWSYESFRHRTRSGNSMSDHLALGGVIAILVLTAAAVAFSLHRNSILIESFDQPDLTELRVCLSDHRMEWARAKLGERGWDLIDAKSEAAWKGKSHVLFRRRANGEPIKCILHFLNRSLQIPIGKWDFNRSN